MSLMSNDIGRSLEIIIEVKTNKIFMRLHPLAYLFHSGSSLALGHPNYLGGCRCNATREGLLNKGLWKPNHLGCILVPRPKDVHIGVPFSSLVHHIVGVVVGAPSVGLWWR